MCIVSLLDFLRNEPIITDRKPSQEGKSVTISLVATAQNTLLWQFVYSQSLRISEPLRNSRIGSISNQMCHPFPKQREREFRPSSSSSAHLLFHYRPFPVAQQQPVAAKSCASQCQWMLTFSNFNYVHEFLQASNNFPHLKLYEIIKFRDTVCVACQVSISAQTSVASFVSIRRFFDTCRTYVQAASSDIGMSERCCVLLCHKPPYKHQKGDG
jgi:hypothetical protein